MYRSVPIGHTAECQSKDNGGSPSLASQSCSYVTAEVNGYGAWEFLKMLRCI